MKVIGIVAGSGPEAGLDLWSKILRANRRRLGSAYTTDTDAPEVHLVSNPVLGLSVAPYTDVRLHRSRAALRDSIEQLSQTVDLLAVACNTLYMYADDMTRWAGHVDIVSPVSCLRDYARRSGISAVGLLGSPLVRETDGRSPFRDLGPGIKIEAVVDEEGLDRLLIGLKESGRSTPELQWQFETVLRSLTASTVALACTELPLLTAPRGSGKILVDVTQLMAEELVERASR